MKLERKKQISELIEETFNNVDKLHDLLKKSDYDWAKRIMNLIMMMIMNWLNPFLV